MRTPGPRAGIEPATPPANENGIRKCDRHDCCATAEYVVVLLCRPANYSGRPIRMRCGLVVCGEHREPIPDKYMTNESWQELLLHFDRTNQARPARILTEVDFTPITADPDLDGYV
jgi:hypothetical protein